MLTKRMPRIGYVDKTFARIRFLLTKRMPSIGYVDLRSNYSVN